MHPDPRGRAVRDCRARRLRGDDAVWRTANVRPGDRVAVFGCGGVGLSAVLGAAAAGAGAIVAVDPVPAKLDVACELGATDAVPWAPASEETADR